MDANDAAYMWLHCPLPPFSIVDGALVRHANTIELEPHQHSANTCCLWEMNANSNITCMCETRRCTVSTVKVHHGWLGILQATASLTLRYSRTILYRRIIFIEVKGGFSEHLYVS